MTDKFIIGIDLGNTFSSVAYRKNGEYIVIPDDQGNKQMPSVVAFTETERLIGGRALQQTTSNPQNTICDLIRLVGRHYADLLA